MADFGETIGKTYATEGAAIELGTGVHDGALVPAAQVKVALRMTNRHGLIAGATGTGKTRTLQAIAEQLSADDVDAAAKASPLWAKYGTRVDAQSAREMLAARMAKPAAPEAEAAPAPEPEHKKAAAATGGGAGAIGDFLNSSAGKQVQREVVRGGFGLLKKL